MMKKRKKSTAQNKLKSAETLDKKYRRRRIWLRVVSVLSSIAVFCTVYALILPAITWETSTDDDAFTVNGKHINQNYTWIDEDGGLALAVNLVGNATYEGKFPLGAKPEFSVEMNPEEETQALINCAEEADAQPIVVMKMHLKVNGADLNLSGCTADVVLRMDKDVVASAKAVYADETDGEADETATVFTVMNEQGELAAVDLDKDEDPILYFTVQADESVAASVVSNPNFTIEHYFWFPEVDKSGSGTTLPFIDTSKDRANSPIWNGSDTDSLKIPNQSSLPLLNVPLDTNNGNKLLTQDVLKPLFAEEETNYRENPQINYMNRLFNDGDDYNSNYTLTDIWVKPANGYENYYYHYKKIVDSDGNEITSVGGGDYYFVYEVPESSEIDENGNARHYPERIRFTNNPSNTHIPQKGYSDAYPYEYTILIQEGTIVRLVFSVTTAEDYKEEANFFDYDITDGYIYTSASDAVNHKNEVKTSKQTDDRIWYANTNKQGINNSSNYVKINSDGSYVIIDKDGNYVIFDKDGSSKIWDGTAARYAFGNNNTGTGLGDEKVDGNLLNKYNSDAYKGCTFGLVQGLTDGLPTWADGVIAPDLFSEKAVTGKTYYESSLKPGEEKGYSLGFYRQGGTYTLSSVWDNSKNTSVLSNLRQFTNTAGSIMSNEFWPMDGSTSHGTDGHDLLFGKYDLRQNRRYGNSIWYSFPYTDIQTFDHNSYFGMFYTVDFAIEPGYRAPLEYWFYGDDDMWVFLQELDENGDPTIAKQLPCTLRLFPEIVLFK